MVLFPIRVIPPVPEVGFWTNQNYVLPFIICDEAQTSETSGVYGEVENNIFILLTLRMVDCRGFQKSVLPAFSNACLHVFTCAAYGLAILIYLLLNDVDSNSCSMRLSACATL